MLLLDSEHYFEREFFMKKVIEHKYHFILDLDTILELEGILGLVQRDKIRILIKRILELMSVYIDQEHFEGKNRGSRYELVSKNPDVKRKELVIMIPEKVYRWLKLIQQNLNFYSIAQIVRMAIHFYLKLYREHGWLLIKIVRARLENWNDKAAEHRRNCTPYCSISLKLLLEGVKNRLKIIYNSEYEPEIIDLC